MTQAPSLAILPRAGDVVADKYVVESVAGSGAMGIVYRARHRLTGKTVAVKMLQPHVAQHEGMARRFAHEARASARIAHRNIVDTLDAGEWNGLPYLVMEFLVGKSLDAHLRESGPLSVAELMNLLGPICSAVNAAHRAGVIHRDLKPENIFLCEIGDDQTVQPKLLDFGVSKVLEGDRANMTATGHAVGTALYMSLEQMIGSKDVTPASDVYALGVIIYECLTGAFPYEASSVPELAMKISSQPPIPISERKPELPPAFCDAVMRAIEKDATRRYRNVPELASGFAPWGLVLRDTQNSGLARRPSLNAHAEPRAGSSDFENTLPSGRYAPLVTGPELESSNVRRTSPTSAAGAAPDPTSETSGRRRTAVAGAAVVAVVIAAAGLYGASISRSRSARTPIASAPALETRALSRLSIVAADRPGGSVRIDGELRGTLDRAGALTLSIAPGEHFVELANGDIVVASRSARVESGGTTTIAFDATTPAPTPQAPTTPAEPVEPASDETPQASDRHSHHETRAHDSRATSSSTTGTSPGSPMSMVQIRGQFEADPY